MGFGGQTKGIRNKWRYEKTKAHVGGKRTTHVTDSVNRYEAQHSETKEDKFALESRLRSNGCRRGRASQKRIK